MSVNPVVAGLSVSSISRTALGLGVVNTADHQLMIGTLLDQIVHPGTTRFDGNITSTNNPSMDLGTGTITIGFVKGQLNIIYSPDYLAATAAISLIGG